MIQFRRGVKLNWLRHRTPLADGQPGYDRSRNKIKIGDGERLWSELPYASGLFEEEIFSSEENAKHRVQIEPEDRTIITYGPESPDEETIGKLYLQHYDAEPETDYIISFGVNGGWTYQKWKSGIAKCYITFNFETSVQSSIGESQFYMSSNAINKIDYPFTFIEAPSETATVQSQGGLVWLVANKGFNTSNTSASYSLVSPDSLTNTAIYHVTLSVEGRWR